MINKEDFEKTIEIRNDLASLAMVCPQFSGITNKTIHYISKLENRIKELEADNYEQNNIINNYIEIEKEHQKTVGELIEENKKLKNHYECRMKDISMLTKHIKKIEKENQELKEILTGKSIQEMGTSDLYKED